MRNDLIRHIAVIISVLWDGSNLGADVVLSNKSGKKHQWVVKQVTLPSPDSSVPPDRLNCILTGVSLPP